MTTPVRDPSDPFSHLKTGLFIGRKPAGPGDVAATVNSLASAIEIIADETDGTEFFTDNQRLGAILGIARCIRLLNAEMPEALDRLMEQRG
ncbi:MAG: hypothetical protein FD175_1949 [Beijerinckiaceae bacterium]|nr:MAG: hypothetical protein FD175_1949 [Beijerinckiaceae bacterium]